MRPRLPFFLTILVGALGCAGGRAANAPAPSPAAAALGAPLPLIELRTLDGQPARLDERLRGRPALVSLWATWCDACVGELDALRRLHAEAQPRGVTVLAVAVGEPRTTVSQFVA